MPKHAQWFEAWPILTQLYHGTISVFISAFAIFITGSTSVIQHRLVNAIMVTLYLYISEEILERYTENKVLRHLSITLFACMPVMVDICLTQYYIELPGIVLVCTWIYQDIFESVETSIFPNMLNWILSAGVISGIHMLQIGKSRK